jgi:surface antigen
MVNAFSSRARRVACAAVLATSALACSAPLEPGALGSDDGEVGVSVAALSVCDETVPANRFIDGIPAYAQCAGSMTTAIYSDDGINTSTTKVGPEWVRTQYSGGYQCTELAHRYFYFRWDIDWVPRGNAGSWCDTQPPADIGIVQTMEPVHGDAMVLAPGSCGASASTGHVTVVDVVNGDSLSVVEQNGARRGTYKKSCAKCFLHVVANDGTPGSVPTEPTDPMGNAGSAAPPPTTPPAMTPVQPPVTTPPPTTPPPSNMPMAGAAAPVPSTPVPLTPPPTVPAPPAAAPMIAPPPALPVPVDQTRDPAAGAEAGCVVASAPGGGSGDRSGLALIALALLGLATRRRTR